jgi:DNA-binding IclR family transcriptional regulator
VLDRDRVLIVEKITGHRRMPMLSQVGGQIPAYCSSLGRAILAHSTEDVVALALAGDLPARTGRTLTDPDAIRHEIVEIRERGYAFDHEEGNPGVSCIGAAIFGPLGEVVAALSVTGPSAMVRADRFGPAVRMAAAAASRVHLRRR